MLFTGCNVLAGEGTLIIKAFHKGKHQRCISIHGHVGSDRITDIECSQQECCGECGLEVGSFCLDFISPSLNLFIVKPDESVCPV